MLVKQNSVCLLHNVILNQREALYIITTKSCILSIRRRIHASRDDMPPAADDMQGFALMIYQSCGLDKKISFRRTKFFGGQIGIRSRLRARSGCGKTVHRTVFLHAPVRIPTCKEDHAKQKSPKWDFLFCIRATKRYIFKLRNRKRYRKAFFNLLIKNATCIRVML